MAVTQSLSSMYAATDEPALVAGARAGDDRAFEELYARYRPRIFAFILSRVHDHGRAEDIAQDVFMSALRRLRAGDQEIAFKPWIYEIAKNACIDEFRRGSRSREIPLDPAIEPAFDRPATLSVVPTPAAAVESRQRMDDLRGAFGGLSDTYHRLLVMREFEGLSYDEIGVQLDMTRPMVESGLFRARRKLTEEYQELASGRRCEQVQSAIEAGTLASARALGLRDRRRFSRHLSHCQACRHVALMAGVDEALVKPRSVPARIAALLPFPVSRLRWPWWRGRSRGGSGMGGAGVHPLTTAALHNAPVLADQGSVLALGPAAVAVAALAIAGLGGDLVHNAIASGHAARPPVTSRAPGAGYHGGGAAGASGSAHHVITSSGGSRLSISRRPTGHRLAAAPAGATSGRGVSAGGSGGSRAGSTRQGTNSAPSLGSTVHKPAAAAGSAVQTVGSSVQKVGSAVGSTVQHVGSAVGSTVQKVGSAVGSTVQTVGSALGSTTQAAGSTVSKTVQTAGSAVGSATQQAGSTVTSTAGGAAPTLRQAGSTASGALQGATGAVGKTLTSVTSSTGSSGPPGSGLLP